MQAKKRRWWPVVKALLSLAILIAVGWRFASDLSRPELYQQQIVPGWLVLAGLLYLVGLGLSGIFWRRLLLHLGQSATPGSCLRAYFVSQVGKYLPGKAWAVLLRIGLIRGQGVPAGTGALTTFYEVLTTMASGAIVACVLFFFVGRTLDDAGLWSFLRSLMTVPWPDDIVLDRSSLVLIALVLSAITLGPIFPPIFNRIVNRLSIPFRTGTPPQIRVSWLVEGLMMIAPAWMLYGIALCCTLQSIPGLVVVWEPIVLARLTAIMAVAYVAGFVVVLTPGGLGIREFLLTGLLIPEISTAEGDSSILRGEIVLGVLLLRLVWTFSEIGLAGLLYIWPTSPPRSCERVNQLESAPET